MKRTRRAVFLTSSLLLGFLSFTLGGCGRTHAPSPAELREIAARRAAHTATGTVLTKLEARTQPEAPRAGEVSIWDLKVFKSEAKPDGSREEWGFFAPLPQPSGLANTTDVLMNAWLISRDGRVFLPARPSYKAYGSFVTDWTPPRAGAYTLFAEYQPSQQGMVFPTEMAKWNFTVAPGQTATQPLSKAPHWTPNQNPAPITLRGASDGDPAGTLVIDNLPGHAGDAAVVTIKSAPEGASEMELAALSAGGQLLHFRALPGGQSFGVSFPHAGMYRVWAYFSLNGAPYAAPLNRWVS